MEELMSRFFGDLFGRTSGPLSFRFILQPVMAMFYAYRDGITDAHAGRRAYFWSIFTHPGERRALLQEGFRSVGRVIGLGVVMELIYQAMVLRAVRPLELIVVVLFLAFVPYLLLRGPINRLAQRRRRATSER
jgi:hypothetical protein